MLITNIQPYLNPNIKLTYAEADALLQYVYYKSIGKTNDSNSLSLDIAINNIEYREHEDPYVYTDLYNILTDYFIYNIKDNINMSIEDYLSMTSEMREDINTLVRDQMKRTEKIYNELKEENEKKVNDYDYNMGGRLW